MRTISGAQLIGLAAGASLALAGATSASAQGVGIIAGFPVGTVLQSASGGFNSPTIREHGGFTLGFSAESDGRIGIGVNVLYVEHDVSDGPNNDVHRTSSLDLPLYLKATFPEPGVSPFLLLGPQGSVVLGCSNACPSLPNALLAAVVGAGVTAGTARRVSLQVRYVMGFTHQDTGFTINPGGFFEPATSFQRRSLQLLAAFRL